MKFCEEVGDGGWGCVEVIVLILHGSLLNHMTNVTKLGVSYVDHMTTVTKLGVSHVDHMTTVTKLGVSYVDHVTTY